MKDELALHAERDLAMGWLIRFAASDDPDAYYAQHIDAYINRLRDIVNLKDRAETPTPGVPGSEDRTRRGTLGRLRPRRSDVILAWWTLFALTSGVTAERFFG